jgi:hypothetical protein
MLSNRDLWLLLLMKKEKLAFSDIMEAVDRLHADPGTNLPDIFDLDLPGSLEGLAMDYRARDRHGLFHMILNDLDALVEEGLAGRTMESTGEGELEEQFAITPAGVGRVGALIVELQGGGFRVLG